MIKDTEVEIEIRKRSKGKKLPVKGSGMPMIFIVRLSARLLIILSFKVNLLVEELLK
jgi:hypothetical protein